MSLKYNVCELTVTEIRVRITDAPTWVKNAPVQAQRRWLATNYPNDYYIGKTPKGSIGGNLKNRGVWTSIQCETFKTKAIKTQSQGLKVNWKAICKEVVEELNA